MTSGLVHRLITAVDAPDDPCAPISDPADLTTATEAFGEVPVQWAIAVSRMSFQLVRESIPEDRARQLMPQLQRAIEQSSLDLLLVLDGYDRPVKLNPDQVTVVERLARNEVPFERIVQGLRIIQRHWTRELLALVDTHEPARDRRPLLHEVTEVMAAFFDDTVDAVISDYLAERQRLMARRLTSQREMVSSIIAGDQVSNDAAHRTLGINLAQHHLALVLWEEPPPSTDAHAELEAIARRAAAALDCPAPLMVAVDNATLWMWLSRPQGFTDQYLAVLGSVRLELGTARVAVGEPGRGLAGFRRSHLAARDAHRIATSARSVEQLTAYRHVGLVALLTADLERARWFVAEELGPLSATDRATAELRLTLHSYLDHNGSLVKTAADLHVHRNTVVYRLGRIERLLGRRATDSLLNTHAALRVAAVLGPEVCEAHGASPPETSGAATTLPP